MSVYFYNFSPLAPVIEYPSGRYSDTTQLETKILYDSLVPSDKIGDYEIWFRINGENEDRKYRDGQTRLIETMSLKAYVKNTATNKISKNAVNYYIIESNEASYEKVYIRSPYNTSPIASNLLSNGEYAEGIKLYTYHPNAEIHYNYTYTLANGTIGNSANDLIYNDTPIMVTPQMTSVSITTWLFDGASEILNSRTTYNITITQVSAPSHTGGSGGGGGTKVIDNTRKYTLDIFGNESAAHISYINGYPDGSVKADGKITREEMTAVLYRITNHMYEKPFSASGSVFSDVLQDRWSAHNIEYMAEKGIITGYPDGEFKPQRNLTRAEFASLICRFAKLDEKNSANTFGDLEKTHWAYNDILTLSKTGLINGYEDNTFKPEREITRAEVMTVINKILGRRPMSKYIKSLNFAPYADLDDEKWYYADVMEATITHEYYLDDNGIEIKWENCR